MREEDESRDGAIATRVSPTCERVMVDARSVVLLGETKEGRTLTCSDLDQTEAEY